MHYILKLLGFHLQGALYFKIISFHIQGALYYKIIRFSYTIFNNFHGFRYSMHYILNAAIKFIENCPKII